MVDALALLRSINAAIPPALKTVQLFQSVSVEPAALAWPTGAKKEI